MSSYFSSKLSKVSLVLFSLVVVFLNGISKGRAVGSIGLILALLGLTGEVYQVCTMFLAGRGYENWSVSLVSLLC